MTRKPPNNLKNELNTLIATVLLLSLNGKEGLETNIYNMPIYYDGRRAKKKIEFKLRKFDVIATYSESGEWNWAATEDDFPWKDGSVPGWYRDKENVLQRYTDEQVKELIIKSINN